MADNGLSDEQLDKMLAAQKHERNTTPITSGRTDQQIATEYADRMLKLLNQVTEVLNEARREHGMTISFGYAPPNQFGIQTLASLEVSKKLC